MTKQDSWIFSLLSEKFYDICQHHEYYKKSEKNIFCIDCLVTICIHCYNLHHSHRLLKVRRYVYHDVVRLEEMEKLFNCQYVQSYTTNNAKVVFLNQRPQARPTKTSGATCLTCDRALQGQYHFCSVACKVQYLVAYEGSISRYLYYFDYLSLSNFACTQTDGLEEMDDRQMTPNSVLDGEIWSTSSGNSHDGCVTTVECIKPVVNVKRKKRSSKVERSFNSNFTLRPINRGRKRIPIRSPLF